MKLTLLSLLLFLAGSAAAQPRKAVFIILDGISADALEKTSTPNLDEIAKEGGYTRAWLGGIKGSYSESPTVSAVGYNHLLTATWSHKHNVFDNDIDAPNYHYWNIFRIVETANPEYHTAIFSSWEDNRTKLIGESLPEAGGIELDYSFDGLEHDTVRFPHSDDRMFYVDEAVSKEAARYIEENGPDLSWIYLQFTDDMGHMHGDSPAYTDAIQKADAQVGRIWSAIKQRKAASNEDWMIVVTTDHGRDAATGKHHGGHSTRERTIWITTNAKDLNAYFFNNPAIVDITPSILRFMDIAIPEQVRQEMDGIPFIGPLSFTNLSATRHGHTIALAWQPVNSKEKADIFVATTNHFRDGKPDTYRKVGRVKLSAGTYSFPAPGGFCKVVVKGKYNVMNVWRVGE